MTQNNSSSQKTGPPGEPQATPQAKQMLLSFKSLNRRSAAIIAAGVAFIGLILVLPYYLHAIAHESTDDAFIDAHIVPISPRIAGHVVWVGVTDNQQVVTGDLLVELDARDVKARLDASQAALRAAEAMVQNAQALAAGALSQQTEAQLKVTSAQAELDQAAAEINALQAKHRQAAMDLRRYRKLARSKTITPQQLNRAETEERTTAAYLKVARSKVATQQSLVQQAQAAFQAAEYNVYQAQAQVAARQAQWDQARADVAQAILNRSATRIYAPRAGYVTKKNVEPGAFVQVGQYLMAIVSPAVWVTANFKETQLTHMRPGQPVTLTVDTYPQVTFQGRVASIQRGTGARFSLLPPENATGNFVKVVQRIPVKIVFEQSAELAEYMLAPGMSVVPEVNIKAKPQ